MLEIAFLLNANAITDSEMNKLINKERKTPVTQDAELTKRANARAKQLCEKKQWSHDGWRNNFTGLNYKHQGENLAKGFKSDAAAHKKLMSSPTHKANITNPNFKKVGLGKTKCKGKVISVQLFGG